ncbi:MAG: heme A synthase, partial [Rhodanobacteraceae bacterium]
MQSMPLSLRTLAWVACAFAFCVIVFGAFVRLSNAGLSCPDWPTCYGRITWPVKPAAVARADKAFPDRPVETHKAWREQSHRFLAGTLGVLVLVEALVATVATKRRFGLVIAAVVLIGIGIPLYMAKDYVASSVAAALGETLLLGVVVFWRDAGWRRIAVLTLAVVCFQALLGMWTVTWLLKPIVVSGHLLGGMATFALLAWVALRLSMGGPQWGQSGVSRHDSMTRIPSAKRHSDPGFRLRGAAIVGLVLLACQIFLGGWTSSNYAALACGIGGSAFPTCLGQWWPAMDFHQGFILWRGIGVDFQGGILDAAARTAIQIVHRFGAAVVFVYLLWLAYRAGRAGLRW